jgi:hypothetical protein
VILMFVILPKFGSLSSAYRFIEGNLSGTQKNKTLGDERLCREPNTCSGSMKLVDVGNM